MRRLPTLSVLLAAVLGMTNVAGALGTPAGTTITNQAFAEALGDSSAPVRAVSNVVSTGVRALCGVSATPGGTATQPGQRAAARSGEEATFAYRVVNTGNAAFSFSLEALRDAAGTADVRDLRLYRDANGNGQLDPGEPEVREVTLATDGAADLLLRVQTAPEGKGLAYVALGAACPDGNSDRNNVAELRVDGLARLVLEKSFGAASVAPGGDVPVTLRVRNTGNADADSLTVTDLLDTPELSGLTFMAGSAHPGAGRVEYSADGRTWQAAEEQPIRGLRWTLAHLAAGGAAELTFALRAGAGATAGERVNVATLMDGAGTMQQARAAVQVGASPVLALGPVHNSEALPAQGAPTSGGGSTERPSWGEMSRLDMQFRDGAVMGQPVCFWQTLKNTGNLDDRVTLGAALDAGEAETTFWAPDGTPLAQPIGLAVGASLDFRACFTPRSAAVRARLTAMSSVGAQQNSTLDWVDGVDARGVTLLKTVDPQGVAARGAPLTYSLAVTNPYPFALTGVVVRDALSPALEFISADAGGQFGAGAVTWHLARLEAGETVRLHLVARVRGDVADGGVIENRFSMTSNQTPDEQVSAPVATPVWTAALVVEKAASSAEVQPGDRLTYRVRIRNTSPAAGLRDLTVTDELPAGLEYLPGSARLEDAALADPAVRGRTLAWALPLLGAGSAVTLSYDVRVLPGTPASLTNVVSAQGFVGAGEVLSAVASNVARAAVRVRPGLFASTSALVGRVFVDRDRDGVYREGFDTPLPRARVLLADGRSALTDAQGRYHFADAPGPVAALRLDPGSVPYPPLSVPQDGGLPGSRSVLLTGLTSVDFPLIALVADAAVTRGTTLRGGPLTLDKSVRQAGDGTYTVRLTLRAAAPLPDFHLTDPLPQGAALLEGRPDFQASSLPAGETILTYRFRLARPVPDAVTDPVVRWRSP